LSKLNSFVLMNQKRAAEMALSSPGGGIIFDYDYAGM
jgi:hypothetical protein